MFKKRTKAFKIKAGFRTIIRYEDESDIFGNEIFSEFKVQINPRINNL